MAIFNTPWTILGALLACSHLHFVCALSPPSIEIGLEASFNSAPYLLELLECAADENATSYFPLLDRIADGYFSKTPTDKELYEQFIQLLKDDGHMKDGETLSSYKLALSLRSSAPRIEAHYQYYYTTAQPSLRVEQDTSCVTWVLFDKHQYCSPSLDKPQGSVIGNSQEQPLQFDRVLGNPAAPASILYADITSPTFGHFHKTLVKTARADKTSYRVRHMKSLASNLKPLVVPGYGVELALKKTDYIVIDDRQDEAGKLVEITSEKQTKLEDGELADLKPLSTSELTSLSIKASSFIMQSEDPFETLLKLSQDFPKYSSAVVAHNISEDFVREHNYNRQQLVPAGYNVWWVNGVQMSERQIEALSILDILRKERKLINGVRELGLTGPEAIKLLSHQEVATVKAENAPLRFDWRDDLEGGNVIIWMNDLEKDKRYADWSPSLAALLQQTYPGQLPQARRDCFQLVVPVDFTNAEDVRVVADTLQGFVKRKLIIRIGLVPLTRTPESHQQAKLIYHLVDNYGLASALRYLEESYHAQQTSTPHKASYEAATDGRKLRLDKVILKMDEVLESMAHDEQIQGSKKWVRRLSAESKVPPLFINGVALLRDETWLQVMSSRVTADLQAIQEAIFKESFRPDEWLPSYFLVQAVKKRNILVVPEDEKSLRIFDVNKLVMGSPKLFTSMPRFAVDPLSEKADWAHMILIADFNSDNGVRLLRIVATFREAHPSIELILMHSPSPATSNTAVSDRLFAYMQQNAFKPFKDASDLNEVLNSEESNIASPDDANGYWHNASAFIKSLDLKPGQSGILLNGRLVGPIVDTVEFDIGDFEQLLSYEHTKRISPAYAALKALGLYDKIAQPLDGAKLSSIVASSTVSDTPEGIFEQPTLLRMSQFHIWNSSHTVIEAGDVSSASVQVAVLLDPASEQAQRWIPILMVLSKMEGIHVKIWLNPKERLQELPVKRFYRYVFDSEPKFDESGSLQSSGASFHGIPKDALLTVGMDVPAAWLVSPKVSAHDLDNIKLSSTKTNIVATYELEYILIEGHSREMPSGQPPRGAQLVLGTEKNPQIADTIIMANLGYFQFKANPGFYRIDLQKGRSSDIYQIDSLGSLGYSPVSGDESTEVILMSFRGATLYPRLSRKVGMELEDVLEPKAASVALDFVSRGLAFAQNILGKGIAATHKEKHAEINIFSVASGHLYERMLNIMMVSVMKHTKHTVKFWFIEQFLSPSFKDFIPYLAAEYGFEYEMVTYKWPHWLRAQAEKQREIWGYKILFLDVLFPLSLDKVIFVDADQIVRTDMIDLVNHDLNGAPYGFTPMCDSRTEMEGFRFWKQGYWERFLGGLPYHISALYVVDLHRFRQIAAGDRLRQQYHSLSADPNSLANLDQDLPNHMQSMLPIHSLPQEWLWCETWCSDESLKDAKTIDLCNNPLTKEPKLDRARRQVPEWTIYDDEIAAVNTRRKGLDGNLNGVVVEETNTKSRTLQDEPADTKTKKDEL